mmetsp:Transcript_36322/g.111377  ORF Transcript_36322/g.111377 Transcript_36322/m.111377 type:complete len:218 (-) Transcript_36322:23-676(-)
MPKNELVAVDPEKWDVKRVGKWLGDIGMSDYVGCFQQHCVEGKTLGLLTENHLKEIGVTAIGHRVLLHQKCHEIRRAAVHKLRTEILWESDEMIYTGGCQDWCFKQCVCYPCRVDPDHYKLTGSALYVSEVDNSKVKGCNCQVSKQTRTIDLSAITGTNDYYAHSACDCGCAADVVNIELKGSLGLPAVAPLHVPKGEGRRISELIASAVEHNHMDR